MLVSTQYKIKCVENDIHIYEKKKSFILAD